jgi:hypothetical protein
MAQCQSARLDRAIDLPAWRPATADKARLHRDAAVSTSPRPRKLAEPTDAAGILQMMSLLAHLSDAFATSDSPVPQDATPDDSSAMSGFRVPNVRRAGRRGIIEVRLHG